MDFGITIAILAQALGWTLLVVSFRRDGASTSSGWLMVAALALITFSGFHLVFTIGKPTFHVPVSQIEAV